MNYYFFGLRFTLDPIAFNVPGTQMGIYWYGVLITLGFILALVYGMKRAKRFSIDPDKLFDCVLITTPLAILGARAYYILFNPNITNLSTRFIVTKLVISNNVTTLELLEGNTRILVV